MADHAVIIPVYGEEQYTDVVLGELYRERHLIDVYVVDNKGDYSSPFNNIAVLKPGQNLRWTKGTNFGWKEAMRNHKYYGYFLMNNDVRLSKDFIANMVQCATYLRPELLGPLYNDVWEHQKSWYLGDAARFNPQFGHREVKFIDGTCMYVPRHTVETVGILDEENFGEYGWGADFDYALRIHQEISSAFICVTFGAYLEHFHQGTAKKISGDWNGLAGAEMNTGMTAKWGTGWQKLLGV